MPEEIGTIEVVSRELAAAISPLAQALESPESLQGFLDALGWQVPEDVAAVGIDPALVEEILSALQAVLELDLETADKATIAVSYGTLLGLLGAFIAHLYSVQSRIEAHLDAAFLTATKMAEELPRRALDYLIVEHCSDRSAPLFYGLITLGIIELLEVPLDENTFTSEHTRRIVHYDRVPLLLTNPPELFREAYGWGTPTANLTLLLERLFDFALVLGLPAALEYPVHEKEVALSQKTPPEESEAENPELRLPIYRDDENAPTLEAGLTLMTLSPPQPGGLAGLALCPYATESLTAEVPLDAEERWLLTLAGTLDLVLGIGIVIRPDQDLSVLTDLFGSSTTAAGLLKAEVRRQASPDEPVTLFGTSEGTHFSAHALYAKGQILFEPQRRDLSIELGADQGKLSLSFTSADGFLQTVMPDSLDLKLDIGVGWSSQHGLYFRGGAGLEVTVPVNVDLFGLLRVDSVYIALQTKDGDIDGVVAATATVMLGPVAATVEQVGFHARIRFPSGGGNLGVADLRLGFKPPTSLGLAIDAKVVVGGGFLRFDPEKKEYSGFLQLQIAEKISVKAIGLLSTQLPGGVKGYSLVVIIFVEGFTPIQLGFGFTLTGIGGLLAVNRTFSEEALRAGLKNHTLDSVMFPKDPIRNAPQILSDLNKVFPPANGHHLFGPMVQLAWGTPPLITAELAVVLEFGARLRLLVLAQVVAILPKRENDLVRLQMDAIGLMDFDQGKAELDATLHDSRLLKKFVMTGDMAMRLTWKGSPNFALAVGGLHPAFNPPPNFPKLERIALNLSAGENPRLRCEAYFAITSNTVQFGARAELYASAAGFSIHGDIGFDVLIQFDPFAFLAEFHAQLQLKRGSSNLFKVRVEGSLAGPRPLHVKAKATFEILWWDVTIRVDKTLVSGEKPPGPAPIDVLPRLREALGNPANWIGHLPEGQTQLVTLRAKVGAPTDVLLHPLGTLTVKQNVVPLNLDISRFGHASPAGARRFTISSVSLGGQSQPTQTIKEFFAPAEFFEMSDDEKLSRPSFEPMTAGVRFGSEQFVFSPEAGDCLEVKAIEFETWILDQETNEVRRSDAEDPTNPKALYQITASLLGKQARFGAAGNSELRRSGPARYRTTMGKYRIAKEGWSIVATEDLKVQAMPGVEAGKPASYAEAAQALSKLKQEQPLKAGGLKILRRSETV